jgi:Recombination endonuclease VII
MVRVKDEDRVYRRRAVGEPQMQPVFVERACTRCEVVKPYDQFNFTSPSVADKRNGVRRKKRECRQCCSTATIAHYRKDIVKSRKRSRAIHYVMKYGVTREHADILSDPANRRGKCPICGEVDYLVMDHHHATNKTREMICADCNSSIGYARESIDTLYSMIAYLKKHRGV